MDTFMAIEQRRSVKHFIPEYKLSQEEKDKIFFSILLSPTSFNIQNWRFIVVEDDDLKRKLREASFDQAQVSDASLVMILCGDLKSWDKDPDRYYKNAPQEVREKIIPMIKQFYRNNEQLQRDEVMRSTGLAGQTIMLAAKALGLDSCPMVGFDNKKVAELINLPDDHIISFMIVIGKASRDVQPRLGQLSMEEVIIKNKF